MELKDKEQLKTEILQTWLRSAWVFPVQGPEEKTVLRLTPSGRLKMRRRCSTRIRRSKALSWSSMASSVLEPTHGRPMSA